MHIPLLVLGITPESVRLARHLSKTLKVFSNTEIEFFSDYSTYLDKQGLVRDPGDWLVTEGCQDEDDLARSLLPTREHTYLKYASGLSSEARLEELWSNQFAYKAQKQVIKIELDRKLVHAIG